MHSARFSNALACALTALFLPLVAMADEPGAASPSDTTPLTRRLSVGLGAGFMRFDSNFKFTNRDTGRSVFVDSEGTLGLPETKTVPVLFGSWRPSQKHGIGFSYFSVRRESELLLIDRNLGDLNLSGTARLTDDSIFYGLAYNYTLLQDDRALMVATLGFNVIDLEYRLDARGAITIGDEPVQSGQYMESLRQVAPLPMIGIDSWIVLTDKWLFGARATFVAGEVSDVRALITEASIRAKYKINRNVSLILGIRYFDADIDIRKPLRIDEITYGLDGLVVGFDVGF